MTLLSFVFLTIFAGCSPIKGQRFWWDDQKRAKLPNSYMLPEWPAEAPVPTQPEPFVPKMLPLDEIKRATDAQHKMIEEGIPRSGVPDPLTDRQKVPVAKWEGGELTEDSVDVTTNKGVTTISADEVKEKDGNIEVDTQNKTVK